jgi:phosphatidylinositol alpha-1,6-mannosyltransferase
VRDGETGVLVDAEQPDAVAETVARLLDDPAGRARLGAAGRQAVERHYNWDRVTADLRRIGHELGAAARQAAG